VEKDDTDAFNSQELRTRQRMQQSPSSVQTERPETMPLTDASAREPEQAAPGTERLSRQLVVIRAGVRRPKKSQAANAPAWHLGPRTRQIIVLVTTLIVLGITLTTLVPLAPGLSGSPFFSGLSTLLSFSQGNMQIQAHETQTASASQGIPLNISRSQYVAIAEQDATNVGINPTYFVRQIQLESGFNPNAVSLSGAVGIAQILPSTARGLGINPWDPIQALQAAAQMMANSYHQYGDYAKALAAYNAGSASVNNAVASCGSNWLSCMPAETQHYVATIMG
jgi:hypothetical protein